jgi:hypothetical protein
LGISSIIALFLVIGQDPVRTTLQVHSVTAAFLQIVGGLTDLAASMDATFRAASQNATALRLAELQAAYDGLPCNASGYCSLGQTRVWRGDIATNDAMREMLAAVSYRKEIIFTVSNLGGYHLELAMNVIRSAEAQGYGHSFILVGEATDCDRIPPPFNDTTSWYV